MLRLWTDDCGADGVHTEDMVRFNEAIDQALAESVAFFSEQVDRARNLFLGMLGHDMRSPLQTIQTTANYLARLNASNDVSEAATLLISSGASMKALLDDLVDFNRSRLGLGIHIAPQAAELDAVCNDKLWQLRAAYPDRSIELRISGDTHGTWDPRRLQQMIGNLVENGIKYGERDAPVRVDVQCREEQIELTVHNRGEPIAPEMLTSVFNPLTRAVKADGGRREPGLGLGLYIASEIAKAHGGSIEARSDAAETVFTVSLPRTARA